MGETFEAFFALKDSMSGPASTIAAALEPVGKALDTGITKAKAFGSSLASAGKRGASIFSNAVSTIGGNVRGFISDFAGAAEKIGKFAKAFGKIGHAAFSFVDFAAKAAEFKRDTLNVLDTLLGSKKASDETFAAISKFANNAGLPIDKVAEFNRQLLVAGFSAKETKSILHASTDANVFFGKGAGEAALKTIEAIRKSGSVSIGALEEFVPIAKLKENFKQTKGLTDQQFKAWFESGALTANQGIDAILDTIQKAGSGRALGTASFDIASTSFSSQLEVLRNQTKGLFQNIDTSGFAGALRSIGALLDGNTESGKAIREALGGAFKAAGEALSKVFTPENLKEIGNAIKEAANGIRDLFQTSGAKDGEGSGLIKAIAAIIKFTPKVVAFGMMMIDVSSFIVSALTSIPESLATIGREFGSLWDDFAAWGKKVVDWFAGIPGKLVDGLSSGATALKDAAKSVIDGIGEGFKDAWGGVKDTWNGLVDSLPSSFADKLKIKSPSVVFQELGGHVVAGLEKGVNDGAPDARLAIERVATVPDIGGATGSSARGGGAGGRGSPSLVVQSGAVVIHMQPNEDPRAAGERAADGFLQRLGDSFGLLAEESGAPA